MPSTECVRPIVRSRLSRGRLWPLLLCLVLLTPLAGCGGSPAKSDFAGTAPEEKTAEGVGETAPPTTSQAESNTSSAESPETIASPAPLELAQAEAGQPKPNAAQPDPPETSQREDLTEVFAALIGDDLTARDEAFAKLAAKGRDARRDAAKLLSHSPAVEVRKGAAFYLLERFEESDVEQAAGVVKALSDSEPAVRNMALQLVLRSKSLTSQHLAEVAQLLEDPAAERSSRIKAIRGLATMRDQAQQILPAIRRVASEASEPEVRSAAIYALSRVDEGLEGGAAIIGRLREDAESTVRALAATRLGRMSGVDADAALANALADPSLQVREAAAESLARRGLKAIPALEASLKSTDASVRKLALAALGKMGGAARAALPAIRQIAESDEDVEVRKLAGFTIRVVEAAPR